MKTAVLLKCPHQAKLLPALLQVAVNLVPQVVLALHQAPQVVHLAVLQVLVAVAHHRALLPVPLVVAQAAAVLLVAVPAHPVAPLLVVHFQVAVNLVPQAVLVLHQAPQVALPVSLPVAAVLQVPHKRVHLVRPHLQVRFLLIRSLQDMQDVHMLNIPKIIFTVHP